MLSLAQRLAARIEQLDDWEDGGGVILDRQAGAHITSYTGPRAWNAGAGHEPPSAVPLLLRLRKEVVATFNTLPRAHTDPIRSDFTSRCKAFDAEPSMRALIHLAAPVDVLVRLYPNIELKYDIDAADDIVEREFGWYETE